MAMWYHADMKDTIQSSMGAMVQGMMGGGGKKSSSGKKKKSRKK